MSSYDLAEIWVKCKDKFKESANEKIFDVWIKPIIPLEVTDTYYKVAVKNAFFKTMLEENYASVIQGILSNIMGGLSGPAVFPVAVRMVYQVHQAVDVPIIGMGGISNAEDALEFILAGATAVSIGTANFTNPYATAETVRGMEEYMKKNNIEDIGSLIGAVR